MESQKHSHLGRLIALLIVLALLITGAVWFSNYYRNRYVTSGVYYARVPDSPQVRVMNINSDPKEEPFMGFSYKLTGYDRDGRSRSLEFSLSADKSQPNNGLYPNGTYLRIEASNTIVLKQKAVDRSDIPPSILKHLGD